MKQRYIGQGTINLGSLMNTVEGKVHKENKEGQGNRVLSRSIILFWLNSSQKTLIVVIFLVNNNKKTKTIQITSIIDYINSNMIIMLANLQVWGMELSATIAKISGTEMETTIVGVEKFITE